MNDPFSMERGAGVPHPSGQMQPPQQPSPQQQQQQQQGRPAAAQTQQQYQQQQQHLAQQQGDYSARLAPSYAAGWQQGAGQPTNQPGYQPQMFVPGVGYDPQAAGLAAVAAAQHSLTPARPPQPNTRSERFLSDASAMPPPGQPGAAQQGGQYVPRMDMTYANAVGNPVQGWSAQRGGETLSPTRARDERANGSRPGTSEGSNGLLSPVQVKSEARDLLSSDGGGSAAPEGDGEKVDHRKRKRNRTIRSCVPCHNHKRKVS